MRWLRTAVAAVTLMATLVVGIPAAAQSDAARGVLERVWLSPGEVVATGWAVGDAAEPVALHFYVDGDLTHVAETGNIRRPDVARVFPGHGEFVGFRVAFNAPPGPHEICAYALTRDGTNPWLGCLTTAPVSIPAGALDSSPRGLRARGWAVDPDTSDSVDVRIDVDGMLVAQTRADLTRLDVRAALWSGESYFGYTGQYGFDVPLPMASGTHVVCARALNAHGTPGTDSLLGCRAVDVPADPFGELDEAGSAAGDGSVARGWAVDADAPGTAVVVHVYVDGVFAASTVAATPRPDVGQAFPYGGDHGFSVPVVLADGAHTVCAYGVNVSGTPGGNEVLGCRTMAAHHDPVGYVRLVPRWSVGASIAEDLVGWVIDPDTAQPVDVHVYSWSRTAPSGGILQAPRLVAVLTAGGEPPPELPAGELAGASQRYGDAHGFTAPAGYHSGINATCAYAVNAPGTPGGNVLLTCSGWSAGVEPSPDGWIRVGGVLS